MANVFIVTVRFLQKDPAHDPQNKVTGPCPLTGVCTDATGEHHTFLTLGRGAEAVREAWDARGRNAPAGAPPFRVTRVELATWLHP